MSVDPEDFEDQRVLILGRGTHMNFIDHIAIATAC